jgi:heme exporter protein A
MAGTTVQSPQSSAAPEAAPTPALVAAAAAPAVELIDLCKSIDDRSILRQVTLSIDRGQFVSVLGANGTGKSTLLRVVSTLVPPTTGALKLFGERATATSVALRRRIGLIGHQSMLYRDLSPAENLTFFARLYGLDNVLSRVARMLEMIGLSDRAADPVRTFSRGMVQRVAIARALLHDPELILADEPFDGLDAPSIESLEHLLAALGEAGKTILMVNHDIEQSVRISDRVIVLRGGRVAVDQPTHRVYARELLSEVRS